MTAVPRYRKPLSLQRLRHKHAVVEASAGTGKTYLLEHLVVDLLLTSNGTLDQILVVTFTEKATTELQHRVRCKLQQLCELRAGDPDSVAAQDAPDSDCWIIDEAARARLQAALFAFDSAPISTIHGFCQRILRDNAFVQRRFFDEEPVDGRAAFSSAFTAALRQDIAPDPARQAWLSAWLSKGKGVADLETLLFKCHCEFSYLEPPRSLLRPGPLDESALRVAYADFPTLAADDPAAKAIFKAHGVNSASAKAVLKRLSNLAPVVEALRAGAPASGYLLHIEADVDDDGFFTYVLRSAADVPADATPLGRALACVRAAAPFDTPLATALVHHLLPVVVERLAAQKRQSGVFDYQDMLALVARSLSGDGPEARSLLQSLRAQYRWALIDEFQDTDEVQWQIFRRIFLDAAPGGAGAAGHVITVIGDPKQAIYSFRGADVHAYLGAAQALMRDEGPVYLDANFRSSAPLIAAYNAILADDPLCTGDQSPSPQGYFRPDGVIHYPKPVTCGRPDLSLQDRAGVPQPALVISDVVTSGAVVDARALRQSLLAALVKEVGVLLSADGALTMREGGSKGPSKIIGASDIFVLTRSNRESRYVGDALAGAGLPFAYFKQDKLFETRQAREILDLLNAIVSPDDASARARALHTAFFGLSLADVAACNELPAFVPPRSLLHDWNAMALSGDVERLFSSIVEDSGIARRELFLHSSERALTNYLHILEMLHEQAIDSGCTVAALALCLGAYVRGTRKPPGRNADVQRLETDGAAVQIMTIHQAKGLQAPVVFLFGGLSATPVKREAPKVFPTADGTRVVRLGRLPAADDQAWKNESDDESRRIMYVALTRACVRLHLPRIPRHQRSTNGPYRFVNDRLHQILGPNSTLPDTVRDLFHVQPVPCPSPVPDAAPQDLTVTLADWKSPHLPFVDPDTAEFSRIVATRAGFFTTSYSAVKQRQAGLAARAARADVRAHNEVELPDVAASVLSADELPRGRATGIFLHDILEKIPPETFAAGPPLGVWQNLPVVRTLFARAQRRHDIRAAHIPHALRLVHAAFTTPVRLGGVVLPGLGQVAHACREMEFLYPMPERHHPLLAAAGTRLSDRFTIQRGVVKGFIDLLFEHDGRIYVCDWKGDYLPVWDADHLAAHCQRHYAVQARLYTVAALRLYEIRTEADYELRFGGVLYCLLRGMNPSDVSSGTFFQRPLWDDVLAWEQDMLGNSFWGLS